MSIQKILLPVLMTTVLVACGGGGDDDGDQGNKNPVIDWSGNPGDGTGAGGDTAVGNATYKAYLRTSNVAEIGTAPQNLTVPVNAGGKNLGKVGVNYHDGYLTPTADGGYVATGGYSRALVRGLGVIQICSSNKAIALLLPPSAVPATVNELEGQTFNYYEDCKPSSVSTLTFKAGGGATLAEEGEKQDIPANQMAQLLGSRVSDAETGTTAFRAYKLEAGRYVLVEHSNSEGGRVGLWAHN